MALMDTILGKKPETGEEQAQPKSEPAGIPVEEVIKLRSEKLSNNQIIQTLQSQGYSLPQINDALSQAEIKGTLTETEIKKGGSMPENPMQFNPPGQAPGQPMPPTGAPQPAAPAAPGPHPAGPGPGLGMPPPPTMQEHSSKMDVDRIEEIVEAIVDEKWDELVENIEKVLDWKDKVESRIIAMEQQMKSLKTDFDKLHTSILEKIGEYDQNINVVGTNIKALEEVFKRILPNFVENVNELDRITKTMKKSKPATKKAVK